LWHFSFLALSELFHGAWRIGMRQIGVVCMYRFQQSSMVVQISLAMVSNIMTINGVQNGRLGTHVNSSNENKFKQSRAIELLSY
jgi:hypothetical protein